MAKSIAKPIIAEQIPNYKIDSVEFEMLTLGSLPPSFQGFFLCINTHIYTFLFFRFVFQSVCYNSQYHFAGMKVYATDDKEVIMELSMKWAGNPNIIVVAKAFGLKATIQVSFLIAE